MAPNRSVNWTRNGMAPLGLISFWPSGAMPLRASYLQRYGSMYLTNAV